LTSAQSTASSTQTIDPTTIQDNVIVKTNPADTANFYRHGLTQYTVESGDTVVGIASSFGISPQTIMMENKIDESSALKPGLALTILPTTGITYTIKPGDTMESILNKYKISEVDFLDANNIESFDDLDTGAIVVIPLDSVSIPAKPKPAATFVQSDKGKVSLKTASAPSDFIAGLVDFIWPTPVRTITQGFSSRHTGIDISDSKTEPIYAAADGFVEISGYQTNGYGNTIVINHGNGFKTRYGHASELYITAGEYVKQGQLIAKQGHTGRVRGVTGTHLHFEIIKNGTRINPLLYVHP
jgi:murein DD-endopeptidase MepM/ murein hydrolase activator NlpD